MPRTHKPSNWQPSRWQLDEAKLKEVAEYYPPPVMKKIVKAARLDKLESDPAKREELTRVIEQNIIGLGVWAMHWLTLTHRPTPAQRRAALKRVQLAASALQAALEKIDGDSAEELRRAMLADPFSHYAIGIDPKQEVLAPMRGYAQYQTLVDLSGKITAWAAAAGQRTAVPKEGNRRADVKRWYARELINLWLLIGYPQPTLSTDAYQGGRVTGALMSFTEAAAGPLGLLPMAAALRQAIALWKEAG